MKFSKIVGFGDSWMWGDELIDPSLADQPGILPSDDNNRNYRQHHCFLGQLAEHYQVPCVNFGIPGGSLQSAVWNFLWWLDHEPDPTACLVIVENTYSDRISHFDSDYRNKSRDQVWQRYYHGGLHIPQPAEQLIKLQISETMCPEWCQLNYQQTVMTLDGIAARRKLNLVQFNLVRADRALTDVPTLLWPDWNLVDWFSTLQNQTGTQYVKPRLHPNELGHKLIADRLIHVISNET